MHGVELKGEALSTHIDRIENQLREVFPKMSAKQVNKKRDLWFKGLLRSMKRFIVQEYDDLIEDPECHVSSGTDDNVKLVAFCSKKLLMSEEIIDADQN